MTTPTAPLTLDAAPEIAAIREALALGPTPGPWIAGDDEDSDRFLIGPEESPGLVCRPVVSLHAEKDARYIAACNPAAMTAVLATIAQLEEDARRYRWLRDKANDEPGRAPMVVMVDGEFSVTWRDCRIGADLDCAIDAAIAAHGKDAS